MNVLHLSTFDLQGGAPRAAYRLHLGLRRLGVHSRMLVHQKSSNDPAVFTASGLLARIWGKLVPHLDPLPLALYPRRSRNQWSLNWLPTGIGARIRQAAPDVVNLHWVGVGFLPIAALARIPGPLVWTLHDMWAFTGGCHYDGGCGRYRQRCGHCPQLRSSHEADLSRWIWHWKNRAWAPRRIHVVTPSHWLAQCARQSALFADQPVHVIPYGLDTAVFRPHDKAFARQALGLPLDRQLILFGAMRSTGDPRKGFAYLQEALQHLTTHLDSRQVALVIFGAHQEREAVAQGLAVHDVGAFHDDVSLALLYAAADVFVAPSVQDNLPNTVLEALACGTPCVAFEIGGMPDMIEHQGNGYLARPLDSQDLARGIQWVLSDPLRWQQLSQRARARVEADFTLERQAQRYLDLYQQLVESSHVDAA
ncbi:glycosyltransferase family 4 protein [Litorilinea aerophila]|uniref:Glycosyltransferase n=1 Tax=Litorilinea aerophila TaxID=1204385 RepID=A0A540VJR9_9CHLR|nr:glycosyltransferase family 4 protein [Litorilinea aerophila]MCC9075487.1 glycosyltransferase family 4 protein [Litorilinea aerophila]OUC05579.1 glycosyl transferase [Litorilinea aerophila]